VKLNIVGVVNDYNEALEIEEIVKVFLIKQRIINLLSLEKNKHYENDNSNVAIFSKKDFKNSETTDEKILHLKNNDSSVPFFSVRGLV